MSDDNEIFDVDELLDRPGRWEIRTTIYRNGRKVAISDAHGSSYDFARDTVVTNLERRDVDIHTPNPRRRRVSGWTEVTE